MPTRQASPRAPRWPRASPPRSVVGVADRADADLVVVGDIGMGQERRLRLGGVPDRISHAAPCSVLVVRTSKPVDGSASRGPGAPYRKLLVATDGSPTAAHAAGLGAGLAATLGATLTLAYVGDELMGRIVLKDTAEGLGDPELPQRVAVGAPGETIARLAEAEGHDLIVVGNRGMARCRARVRLGSQHRLSRRRLRRADRAHRRAVARPT